MEYRPQIRAARKHSLQQKKIKAKATGKKRRFSGNYLVEEKHLPTSQEIVDRTLSRLRNLGNQRFVLPPFNEHFNRWLMNIRDVLSEFESSSTISADDQFITEASQIISNVELDLEERRRKEASCEETIKSLSATRILLEQINEEYASKTKDIERRKDSEVKRLSSKVDDLKEELDRISQTKVSILKIISKKAREQKEAEATQRLNSTQEEFTLAVQYFTDEQERSRDEYERKKQPLIERIRDYQKEIENEEIDGSLETRRIACEALINAVNTFLQRNLQVSSQKE